MGRDVSGAGKSGAAATVARRLDRASLVATLPLPHDAPAPATYAALGRRHRTLAP
ncbi:MAG TPA: hypothetical protein VFW96_13110 [Thermomicrobiales bacterium]|nr:hypothetical protein [Thermomicrobiales bacterium]